MITGRLLKDPLLHFLVAGACLFGGYRLIVPEAGRLGEKTIVVDREALLTFMQFRAKAFEPEMANRQLDGMAPEERDQMVRDFVREEALYREARTLGMTDNDYIVRRRSVQKMEFIAQSTAALAVRAEANSLKADSLEAYFADHRQDYYREPSVTFTHVFFSAAQRGRAAAKSEAQTMLAALNQAQVPFADALRYGDRFLYDRNYVERTPDVVASHLGKAFAEAIAGLSPSPRQWQGPISSEHGEHLVLLTEHRAGRRLELAEARPHVEQDYQRWRQQQNQERAVQEIVDQYHVEMRL